MNTSKPVLVLAVGNPSRGDDALGPLLLERLAQVLPEPNNVELLTDFQLQIEHATDLLGRERVLFVDAAVNLTEPFTFDVLSPLRDDSFTSHAMTPAAVLAVYQMIYQAAPPPSFLLSIKGEAFELGAELSSHATQHLEAAFGFVQGFLKRGNSYDLFMPLLAVTD